MLKGQVQTVPKGNRNVSALGVESHCPFWQQTVNLAADQRESDTIRADEDAELSRSECIRSSDGFKS